MNLKQKLKSVQLNELSTLATILVIVAITLSIGALVMTTMGDTESVSPILNDGDTVTVANNTYVALTNPRAVTVTNLYNATQTFSVTNVTLLANRTGSMFKLQYHNGTDGFASNTMYVNYTYREASEPFNILESGNESVGVFTDWLSIIAIVIVAVVVLGLIKFL